MSEAEMAGSKSVLHDLSYESPPLFLLLQSFFQDKNLDQLTKDIVKTKKIEVTKFLHFVLYSAGIFENFSNYNNFGHKKFIPELEPADFEAIFKANSLWTEKTVKGDLYRKCFNEIYPLIKTEIFAYEKPYAAIGFPEEGGITGYFSRNINKEDLKVIKAFLKG
jgi:dipeptidyl-peptidase III